jgi:hypothetical protein
VNLTPYEPPTGDEPLDAIEQALVRALVAVILRERREEAAVHARSGAPATRHPEGRAVEP